ncbi:MAG TPA: restriction endonuclease subunit S, partial [Pseudomonas sp.]|nr:restriction endonuclease subunit S [Pseudomonas sp.]
QTQIARFLDHETARIDALIDEQQRLIELLKEKRQAVISHAVTKGLDPTVPMKDSGVEWLGEVPAHWEVGSLRRLIKSVGNGTTADQVDEAEDTVAVSRIETISAGLINFEKVGHVGPQDVAKRFLLNVGDILFSHINSLSMIGNVAIYSGGRPLLHGMNLLRIQPLPSISSEWLLYWLKSKNVRQEVESRAKPAINQASISTDSVRALPALIPPSFEQTQIARFLDYETARIDALIEEANSGVGLLQERRSALISAVVTGKIDVRGWQPPANIQAPESAVAEAV